MAEIASSIIANTVGNLATEYASSYVSYFFHFGKIFKDFENKRNQLELKKARVENDVAEARRQSEVIEKDVQDWLTRAEKELGEAQNLKDEVERNNCFKWCPNWGWRYRLSKRVAETTLVISRLLDHADFPRVGQRAPLQGIEFLISKDFMPSKSSKEAFDRIREALTSDGVNIIGLYGMPGVGKTTLAEEVGKQAKEGKLFHKVIIVTVSQNPDINKIQDEIAKILGFKFEATAEKGRAEELWQRLKCEEKVLIILDDVWEQLKLDYTIGIPIGEEHRGCKILLTTRRQQVCTLMNCQEKIHLNILDDEEAWALFKNNANLEKAPPTLSDVAREVTRECKGLPLAIITMGQTLKDETLDGWKAVNQRLKDSRHLDNQDVCEVIYKSLKVSYDYLKGIKSQQCLQLCSLFPEDYEIEIEELTVCGIGQGMFDNFKSIEDARLEMRATIANLQKSGLLLETRQVGRVKMHDVVRDFVHWMMSKGENMFLVKSGLMEFPRMESFGCYTTISLINSKINNFPDKLEFPKLEVFMLEVERHTRVPSTFFQGMKALKVVFLRGVMLSLEGLQFLPNLRTLRLEYCELEKVSMLGNLKKLEILIIHDRGSKVLCYELTGLTTIRLLDLCVRSSKVSISPNYLQSLVQLEDLRLGFNVEWAISEENANKASLSELRLLPHLTQLILQVRPKCIPKQFVFPPLQSYNIVVGDYPIVPRNEYRRYLAFRKFSLDAFKELFCNVEELILSCMDLEYLSEVTTVPNLKELTLGECGQLQVIFQMDGVFPRANEEILTPLVSSLTSLHLWSLPELRSIWNGPTHHVSLRNLRDVSLDGCNKLTSVFSVSLAQTLSHLEELVIRYCEELEHIIGTEPGIVPNTLPHPLICWPKFKTLKIDSCTQLEYVFPITLAQGLLHLKCIEIANSPQLKQVFGHMAEERDNGEDILLPQLQLLALEHLQNLSSLCPRNYFLTSPSLKSCRVDNCPKLTYFPIHPDVAQQSQSKDKIYHLTNLTLDRASECRILIPELNREGLNGLTSLHLQNFSNVECLYETTDHRQPTIAFSNLVKLVIEEMIGLKKLCNNRPPKGFLQKLEKLQIKNCMILASLSPVGFLQNLKQLKIVACGQLREIFQADEVLHNMETNQAPVLLSNLTSLELEQLLELRCIWKGPSQSFINLQSLKIVSISNCNRLRRLFSPSLVKSLVRLEQLSLHDLPELEQLVTELESDGEQGQQVLNMVKEKVDEQHKPFLPLMLPSLKEFGVSRCPRLTPFVIQQEVNNQAQVKGLYLSNQQCNSFDILLRQSLPNLVHGIVGNHLQFLQRLIISNCSKLKYLFSPMLAQSLPHLSQLYIKQCKELEQIDDKDKTSASSSQGHLQPICFPSLNKIYIEECNNLKCLFSVSVAPSLSQLQVFTIRGASDLEQVFEYEGGIGIEDVEKEIVFPKLEKLSLEVLPRLKTFIPMGYHCSFPNYSSLKVEKCPNLTTSFSIYSSCIHSRTKAAGDAPIEGSAPGVDVRIAWPVGSDITFHPWHL